MEFVVTAIVTFRDGIRCAPSCSKPTTRRPHWRGTRSCAASSRGAQGPASPRELHDRFVAAYNSRDWPAMRDVYAPDLRFIDRRLVGWGELDSLETLVEFWKGAVELAPDLRIDDGELLAIGRRAVVARYVSRGHFADGGGEVEVQFVTLSVIDDGRVTYGERFEGPDAGAALARFEEIGAQTEPERIFARQCRLLSARDWDALADCYAEDYELVDHRALGWEPLRGPAATVEFWRSWIEISPDGEMRFEIVAGDEESILVRQAGHGHAAADSGGGAMEYLTIAVVTFRDGRHVHADAVRPR